MNSNRDRREGITRSLAARLLGWGGAYAVLLTVGIASMAGTFDAAYEEESAGLRGILPPEVPQDIGEEAFLNLGEAAANWKTWSEGMYAELARLYEAEDLDAAGQRAAIAAVRRKLTVMDRAIADPRYRSIHSQLVTLRGGVHRRIAVAEAILDTLEQSPAAARATRLRAAGADVSRALDRLEGHLQAVPGGTAWTGYVQSADLQQAVASGNADSPVVAAVHRKLTQTEALGEPQRQFLARAPFAELARALEAYAHAARPEASVDRGQLREKLASLVAALERYEDTNSRVAAEEARRQRLALRELALDGGARIDEAVRGNYMNYNLRLVATEAFLSRMLEEERTETGPVDDCILEARVRGQQTTTVRSGLDLKPSHNSARFDVTLTGQVRTSTTGVTSQATIFTQGRHHIWAAKEVVFDGEKFHTRPARINVDANNYTTGARTQVSGFPLLGWIADSYAVSEAQRRRPRSEAIAAQRVEARTLPEFNREVEKSFQEANERLETKVRQPLRDQNLFPDAQSFRTTDTELRYSARLMAAGELGGASAGTMPAAPPAPLVVQAHESLFNNAIDRMPIAGRTLTDKELVKEIEKFLSTLLQREVKLGDQEEPQPAAEDEGPDTFVFDANDPIRIRCENNRVFVVIRAGFKQQGKEDIPPQEVTVPLSFRAENGQIHVSRDSVRVSPLERPESVAVQVARAGAIRKKIESALPTRTVDGTVQLQRGEGRSDMPIVVTAIDSLNGWLTVSFQ